MSSVLRALGPDLDDDLAGRLSEGLAAVEERISEEVKSSDSFVSETAGHLLEAGGKRFRPLVTLLAAQFGDPNAPGVVPAAVVVELTHLATLYHDDVQDEAELRRGADSANNRWGNAIAILTGDFLFARASDILADLGTEAVRLQARTFERLVHGQIHETLGPGAGEDPIDHHLRVLADKTGSLIGASSRYGGMLAGTSAAELELLTQWGERIGVAFQLSDDLIDIASETGESGKTPGTDLREHVSTLPVLLLRRAARPGDADLLRALDGDLSTDAELTQVLAALRAHPVMAEAHGVLAGYAEDARRTVRLLPDGPPRAALEALCDYMVNRSA
ncbi:MAG TPA: polyprenyl synthetase family protein [Mycobacteriales bacterium]|nr:polyprenyl synthetase family protein [Mycobacteriales bacterium]